jgi:hypothetical protein
MTGFTDPYNEFQQEFDFGSMQVPPKPEQPKWDDFADSDSTEEASELFHDAIDKYKKDITKWTKLVKKYGGEEHASA